MKKETLTIFFALLLGVACAQDRLVEGTVIDAEDSSLVIGANIVVIGTTLGTVTDTEGKFSMKVPLDAKTLVISYIGKKTVAVDIPQSGKLAVVLETDALNVNQVVVTALGIKREQKSLGFSNQTVSGEDVSTAKEANFINELQGKVAGVQITGNGNIGGSSRITIRGIKSLTQQNQPLIVIDGVIFDNSNFHTEDEERGALGFDYGNAAQDINPNDIETVNVLKGTTAAALYGSRGANGAIIITTKKGVKHTEKGKSPIGVSYSSTLMFNKVSVLPEYQDEYGAGYSPGFLPDEDDTTGTIQRVKLEDDASWGPKMDGTNVRQWTSYYPNDVANYQKLTPFVPHPDNVKDFFRTGLIADNTISLDGANDKGSFRLSFTNLKQKGTIENSDLKRNTLSFNSTYDFTDKLFANLSASYVVSEAIGRPRVGYNSLFTNFTQWWQRNLDIDEMRNYKNPDGSQRAWNLIMDDDGNWVPYFWDNPFWTVYENYENDGRNRVFGSVESGYKLFDWLTIKGRLTTDYYTEMREERVAIGSATASDLIPGYSLQQITNNENNYELMAKLNHTFKENFDLSGFVGINRMDKELINNFSKTQGGLNVPNWYALENSADQVYIENFRSKKRINSVFGAVSFGYKGMLYADFTARNDWSSSLPEKNNSYFYPSVTGSFIFSELLKDNKWLTYGKVRGGWSKVGNDTEPYRTETLPSSSQSFGTSATYVVSNTFNNPDLKPESVFSWEAGTEIGLIKDRIHFDITYYNTVTKDNIFTIQQSASSGTVFRIANAGILNNYGVEFASLCVPVKTKSFTWSIGFNIARNWNEVEELYKDAAGNEVTSLRIGREAPLRTTLEARPGMTYGQIVGTDFYYDNNGNKIIDPATGFYLVDPNVKPLGSVLPDFTGGVYTMVSFKGLSLYILFDFQKGGNIFSVTNMFGKYSGTLAETAENGIRESGMILEGVLQTGTDGEGNPVSDGTPNNITVNALDAYQNNLNGYFGPAKTDVYDASFVKFREFRLTYDLPEKLFTKTPIRGIGFGIVGRNLAILKKNIPNMDPETANSTANYQGYEGGNKPSELSIGFMFNVKF